MMNWFELFPLIRSSATFSLKGEGISGRSVIIRIRKETP
jgi:hypothetical protein